LLNHVLAIAHACDDLDMTEAFELYMFPYATSAIIIAVTGVQI